MKDKNIKEMEALLRRMLEGFVGFPESLEIKTSENGASVLFTIVGHADDTPKLIGSQAVMVNALKVVVKEMGNVLWVGSNPPTKLRAHVAVGEPVVGQRLPWTKFKVNPHYNPSPEIALLKDVGDFIYAECEVNEMRGEAMSVLTLVNNLELNVPLEAALKTIFAAIGKAKGHTIEIEMERQ